MIKDGNSVREVLRNIIVNLKNFKLWEDSSYFSMINYL